MLPRRSWLISLFGKLLYGSYTIDSLDTVKPKGKVEYGLINLNGNTSLEAAESYIVEMTYFEPPYKNGTATVDDDFAQIAFDVDQNRKITAIRWYYYPQQKESEENLMYEINYISYYGSRNGKPFWRWNQAA